MANSEDIEARLCDYIEGELSPSDRADIERHLESHPRHREMIKELIQSRRLVGDLPRVKAPGDMTELLQGQLERSMLLGAPTDSETRGMRQVSRIAAMMVVLILSAGLGAGIYFMVHTASNAAHLPPMAMDATPDSPPPLLTQVTTQPATQPVAVVPQTQPSPAMAVVTAAPATRPVAVATQPSVAADTAILANSTDNVLPPVVAATQPAVTSTTQPSTEPTDDSNSSDDDSVAPDDTDR
jgi:anti-sigma factor RsiW